jgi:hypothetical protein
MLEELQPRQRRDEAAKFFALVAVDLEPGRDVGQGPRLAVRPGLRGFAVVPAAGERQDRSPGVHFAEDRVAGLDLGGHQVGELQIARVLNRRQRRQQREENATPFPLFPSVQWIHSAAAHDVGDQAARALHDQRVVAGHFAGHFHRSRKGTGSNQDDWCLSPFRELAEVGGFGAVVVVGVGAQRHDAGLGPLVPRGFPDFVVGLQLGELLQDAARHALPSAFCSPSRKFSSDR